MIADLLEQRVGRRVGRVLRTGRRVALTSLCLWIAWCMVLRATLRPAPRAFTEAEIADLRPHTGRPDVTDQLRDVLPYDPGPTVWCVDALCGPWDPPNRPELRLIIAYLNNPKMQQVLDRIRDLSGGSLTVPGDQLETGEATVWIPLMHASNALAARTRMRWIAGNIDGACGDLLAIAGIARMVQEQPVYHWWIYGGAEATAYAELACLLTEHPPDRRPSGSGRATRFNASWHSSRWSGGSALAGGSSIVCPFYHTARPPGDLSCTIGSC